MLELQNKSQEELQKLITEAREQLEVRQQSIRKHVIAQIKALAASIGVVVDIHDNKKSNKNVSSVQAKYRNPNNPAQTWSGRGLTPVWLQDLIAAGHSKEEFLIKEEG